MVKFNSLSATLTTYIKNFKSKTFKPQGGPITDEEAKRLANYFLNVLTEELIKGNFKKTTFEVDSATLIYLLNQMRLNRIDKDWFEA